MKHAIKYEKQVRNGRASYVAIVTKKRVAYDGRPFKARTAVRIIDQYHGADRGYRIDFASAVAGTFMPWEAIDEKVYATVEAAKRAVRAFVESEPVE